MTPVESQVALRELAVRYAMAVDVADAAAYTNVFLPDARLSVRQVEATEPTRVLQGHDQLSEVPAMLTRRFRATFHVLGQSLYSVAGDDASGVVYCSAHHRSLGDEPGTSLVMRIRYEDVYRRDTVGE